MGDSDEEVTARFGGGLPARVFAALRHPAVLRIGGVGVGLAVLGAIGQCVSAPASAQALSIPTASTRPPPAGAPSSTLGLPLEGSSVGARPKGVLEIAVESVTPRAPLDAGSGPSTTSETSETALVDLNLATEAELCELPRIGPRRARAILELRARLGGFRRIEDLSRVRGIGRAAIKRLRPRVRVGPPPIALAPPARPP